MNLPEPKNLAVIGSTGSIGTSTLNVVDLYPERFRVATLAARSSVDDILAQCLKYQPRFVALFDPDAAAELAPKLPPGIELASGPEGVSQAATLRDVDTVVAAVTGAAGLLSTYRAIEQGKDVALANKETLVMAGDLITGLLEESDSRLMPVDSEHNALHQCLRGSQDSEVARLWLTASGGPFFGQPERPLDRVTVEEALDHPTWDMGPKISIDSATLMNKGLEVIEAHHLFGVDADRISVVIHPQSTVHSMVEFIDGNFIAQMSTTDMRSAILYALCDPERCESRLPVFDPTTTPPLEFHEPPLDRFPCLRLSFEALKLGRSFPAVLNAANEVAVQLFLERKIRFGAIPAIIEAALSHHTPLDVSVLDNVLEADRQGRQLASEALRSAR